MKNNFRRIATTVSNVAGSPWIFILAVLMVVIWALSGSYFNYSDTWQLVINTGTTIVTFLMVFLIQNTQNRDGKAMQLKLDELIRATNKARESFIDIENLSDEELAELSERFGRIKATSPPDPALDKIHRHINNVLNMRLISIPGEERVTRYIPFTGKGSKKPEK